MFLNTQRPAPHLPAPSVPRLRWAPFSVSTHSRPGSPQPRPLTTFTGGQVCTPGP